MAAPSSPKRGTRATQASDVGSYGITGAGLTANHGDYAFVQAAGNSTALTINPAILTYTADTVVQTYGTALPTLAGTVTGFVLGQDQATATTGTIAFSTPATTASDVGSYGIIGAGLSANHGNYVFVQAAGNATALTIAPATLTETANAVAQVYGMAMPTFTGSVSGFVLGQTEATATAGALVFGTTATAASNVGSYAISGSGLTANHGNYDIVQAPGNSMALTISPATLVYTANAVDQTYGTAIPVLLGSVTGFVNGDTLSSATTGTLVFATSATQTSNVGTYGIVGSGLTADHGNYTLVQATGNSTALRIDPAILTYTANPVNQLYGSAIPALTGSVSGFVLGQSLATATTGTLVFTAPANAGSAPGRYAIDGSGLSAANYAFVQAPGNATALTLQPVSTTNIEQISNATTTLPNGNPSGQLSSLASSSGDSDSADLSASPTESSSGAPTNRDAGLPAGLPPANGEVDTTIRMGRFEMTYQTIMQDGEEVGSDDAESIGTASSFTTFDAPTPTASSRDHKAPGVGRNRAKSAHGTTSHS